ncbi:MAG: FG-GAP repeat protein [Bryobacterales bacterium]|nr:FG-GAP repeat protein [Bryobacterales bacterium]
MMHSSYPLIRKTSRKIHAGTLARLLAAGSRANRRLVALLMFTAAPLAAVNLPKEVSSSDWDQIRAAYEKHRHAVVRTGDGWSARNPGQQWVTRFDGRGFEVTPDGGAWKWGLEVVRYGGRLVKGKPAARVEGNRITYSHDADLSEWFVNDGRGLEHGFTVKRRPAGWKGALEIELAVRGGLMPRADGRGVSFGVVQYGGLKVWDADQRVLPANLTVAGERVRLTVEDAGARYPVTIDPIAQQAYLKASNTGAADDFGVSVAVFEDTLVVGASGEDSAFTGVNGNQVENSAFQSGAAYVFVRSGGVWIQQAYLKASNGEGGDYFGTSVAVSRDTVVVGAWFESSAATGVNGNQSSNSAYHSGAAYVFVRNGGVWSQQAYLKASNTGAGDFFGELVAISGDTVVVGARAESSFASGVNGNQSNNTAPWSGAAYVFARSGGVWSQQAYLKASNTGAYDSFGTSVAVSGDTVVVGAPYEASAATGVNGNQSDNTAGGSGAAYVFVRSGGVWSQQAYLKASNTGAGDQFGVSVGISGDTLVVGANVESSAATGVNGNQSDNTAGGSGAAYVFVRNGGVWSQQAYLKASNTGAADLFGCCVAVSGDRVVVGAITEDSEATGGNGNQADNTATDSGAAYVFVRSGGVWSQQAYLKASNTGANDWFGHTVAISGDTVVVGAPGEDSAATGVNGNQADNTASGSGAAYVFTGVGVPVGHKYVPVTPCRLVDTRPTYAGPRTGAFGPPMLTAGVTRTIAVQSSTTCNIPASAQVYVLNVTADTIENQTGPVDYVTLWPAGGSRPEFMTLRTTTGGYIANSAIVEAGDGGAINAYSSNNTNLIIDITGYFTSDPGTPGYLYYPVNPCRAVDTRGPIYSSLPPPYGNQRMQAAENRTFRLPGSPGCQLPAAPAYSMQLTLAC